MRQAIVDRQAQMEHMLHVVGSERVQNVEQMLMSPPSQTTGCRWTHLLVNLVIKIPTSKCLPFHIKPLDWLIHRHLLHWDLWFQEISTLQRKTGPQSVQSNRRPPTIICCSIWMAWAPEQGRVQQRPFQLITGCRLFSQRVFQGLLTSRANEPVLTPGSLKHTSDRWRS